MNSNHLTPRQCQELFARLSRPLVFLGKVCGRMEKLGFPPTDPLLVKAANAYDAVFSFRIDVHYTGVRNSGVPCDGPRQVVLPPSEETIQQREARAGFLIDKRP